MAQKISLVIRYLLWEALCFIALGFRLLVAAFFLCAAVISMYFFADTIINPTAPINLVVENPIVKPGERLYYVATLNRRKLCKARILRFLFKRWRDVDEIEWIQTIYRDSFDGIIEVGKYNTRNYVSIPTDAPDDEYDLQIYSISECPIVTRTDAYDRKRIRVQR